MSTYIETSGPWRLQRSPERSLLQRRSELAAPQPTPRGQSPSEIPVRLFRRCLSHGGRQHSGKGYRRSKGLGHHYRSVETGDLFLEGGNGGKECGRHEVDLIRSKTFDVVCNPAPTASTSSQPKTADSSSQSKQTSGGSTSGATQSLWTFD